MNSIQTSLSNNTLLYILIGMLIIYFYNTILSSYIKKLKKYFTQIEHFNSTTSLENTATFDTNWYFNHNNSIISNNRINLPILRYGYYMSGSYDQLIGQYFRHKIYPIAPEQLDTGLDTIYKFINGDLDIAFINEELLTKFIKHDCKYLTQYILDKLKLQQTNYDLTIPENLDRLYPNINVSAIGVGFHQDFYLIVNNYSNILEFEDCKDKVIGILEDSYYYYVKLCAAYGININLMERVSRMEELINMFQIGKFDGIFIVAHPKNLQLLKLSQNMKVRYIHLQKHPLSNAEKGNNNNKSTTSNNLQYIVPQQGTNSNTGINRQAIYSPEMLNGLLSKDDSSKETFNMLMKKYFECSVPRVVDLNKFHKSGNLYSYLDTYSTRMILVIRDDIPNERVKLITRNYINNLAKMRDTVDMEEFQSGLNNFSSLEFDYNELVSFNVKIPLALGAKEVYVEEGLIQYEEEKMCKI